MLKDEYVALQALAAAAVAAATAAEGGEGGEKKRKREDDDDGNDDEDDAPPSKKHAAVAFRPAEGVGGPRGTTTTTVPAGPNTFSSLSIRGK